MTRKSAYLTGIAFRGRLPQGSPVSGLLANLSILPAYFDVEDICRERSLAFSFYVDDVALSGEAAREAISPVIKSINRAGYRVYGSRKKKKVMTRNMRQCVNGLVVNDGVGIERERLDRIFHEIVDFSRRDLSCEDFIKAARRVDGLIQFVNSVDERKAARLDGLARMLGVL